MNTGRKNRNILGLKVVIPSASDLQMDENNDVKAVAMIDKGFQFPRRSPTSSESTASSDSEDPILEDEFDEYNVEKNHERSIRDS